MKVANMKDMLLSNIFYDSFHEVVKLYSDDNKEVWEEAATICLFNTGSAIGLFDKSDIIIVYDRETSLPSIVTERIYKENYTFWQWLRLKNYFRKKLSLIKQELGFNIKVSFTSGYIDYIHYKEEWWQWAKKQAKS